MDFEGRTNCINGAWRAAAEGGTFASYNPANNEDVIGRFADSRQADVEAAVSAARAAFPGWRTTPAPARGAILTRMGRLLETHKEELAQAMTREMGKVLTEARGDVQEAIDMAFHMAAFGRLPDGGIVPSERADVWCMARRVPIGVVGCITPFNFPIAIPSWKIFPALLAGNTVVLKPSEDTPGLACEFVRLLHEAGLPAGVCNLVTGAGAETGSLLVESPGVDVISFTGSTKVGRQIGARGAALGKRVSLELGGKNAIVVLDDANLELAVKGALWSAFGTTGQRCTAASRLIVQSGVLPRFREMLVERVKNLRVGDGQHDDIEVGPLINRKQLERVAGYGDIGRGEGARVLTGGEVLETSELARGHFYAPTVFDGVTPTMRIAQEEIFGPVTALIEVRDFDHAIEVANGTEYGLSLAVYTQNVSRAFRAIDRLESGIVYVNLPTSGAEIQTPFGGTKSTGNGHREAGWQAADYCTEWKSIYVNYNEGDELVRAQIDTLDA